MERERGPTRDPPQPVLTDMGPPTSNGGDPDAAGDTEEELQLGLTDTAGCRCGRQESAHKPPPFAALHANAATPGNSKIILAQQIDTNDLSSYLPVQKAPRLACTHANSWQGLTAILHPDTSIAALPYIAWYRHSEDETTLSAGMRTQRLARAPAVTRLRGNTIHLPPTPVAP